MIDYFKHETSIVDPGAIIGAGTKIWHWVHVSSAAEIGQGCVLGQNVFIGNKVRLGDNCKIQNNVSIYDNVILESDVFCGPSMVFTNVTNPRASFPRRDQYQTTLVRRGATIGANATIVCGVEIGKFSFIAAGAVVTKNTMNYGLYAGVPARQTGWMSEYGERIPLPLKGNGEWRCPHTNTLYTLRNGVIESS